MYSGAIEGTGPRYCPSIEDKFVKFSSKEQHQVFLEPEGVATEEIYVNGLSTSLPFDVQVPLVRSIRGCESAEIMRPAYAVEYDFALPTQLNLSLESRLCRNLYLAGQLNGTSGYEEAAAQGLMAGVNAARRARELEPIVLRRDQAYIGVLIDDLVTKGTTEPYRMFTSRAEYRLLLRQDNADMRISDIGYEIGLISSKCHQVFTKKRDLIANEITRLHVVRSGQFLLGDLLRRPEVSYDDLPVKNPELSEEIRRQVEIQVKYAGYIDRQEIEATRLKSLESKIIPPSFEYDRILGLRTEARQKLGIVRPTTIAQASRISGISPADIGLLLVHLKRQ
jgi:tRNA uridine 5-carboxymethylaminomethyl modification enzyme